MTYKVQFTESAKSDIDEITEYISIKLCNQTAAEKLLTKIFDTISILEENPKLFSEFNNERLRLKGYRRMFIDNYVFPYLINELDHTIIISRVIYAKRDYEKYL
jgi:plasmid stabilization system protein ParE